MKNFIVGLIPVSAGIVLFHFAFIWIICPASPGCVIPPFPLTTFFGLTFLGIPLAGAALASYFIGKVIAGLKFDPRLQKLGKKPEPEQTDPLDLIFQEMENK